MSCPKQANTCVHSTVGASILNCNFVNIKAEVAELVSAGVDFIHLDVMDGNFVNDITFGPSFVKSLIAQFPDCKFEVHMMVEFPMKFVQPMANAGVQRYIFHYEVTKENRPDAEYSATEMIEKIHQANMEASIAINPETGADKVVPFLTLVESVLVMTVRPGLGGQKFMQDMMAKVQMIREKFPLMDIELDGGVGPSNTELCGKSGANRAVCGTALLRSQQKSQDIRTMQLQLYPVSS